MGNVSRLEIPYLEQNVLGRNNIKYTCMFHIRNAEVTFQFPVHSALYYVQVLREYFILLKRISVNIPSVYWIALATPTAHKSISYTTNWRISIFGQGNRRPRWNLNHFASKSFITHLNWKNQINLAMIMTWGDCHEDTSNSLLADEFFFSHFISPFQTMLNSVRTKSHLHKIYFLILKRSTWPKILVGSLACVTVTAKWCSSRRISYDIFNLRFCQNLTTFCFRFLFCDRLPFEAPARS